MLTKDSVLKDLERLRRYASKNKLDKPCYMFNSNLGLRLAALGLTEDTSLPIMLLGIPIFYNEYLDENVASYGSAVECDKTIDYTLKNSATGLAFRRFISECLEANNNLVDSTASLCYMKLTGAPS